ncbi:hypothetical protein Aeqsu_2755 [Aequorivita sublithincola DSM 14238]|uniref:Uncharacterized protein n=1 Tax=Aequorivita sublithincola (strain DSM 14238 / LMG 21431 / ACAM 643 / 9-3) TaxID=746697 RepID=I3YYY7_AEQSU|nr:hypothetical protein Aeqsu_2755 [Aequorivita sublithincola DSM 14238]
MNFKKILLLLTFSVSIIFISCNKNDDGDSSRDLQVSLQHVADSVYTVFNDEWDIEKGGIHLYISGPAGTYQASSNISLKPPLQTHTLE